MNISRWRYAQIIDDPSNPIERVATLHKSGPYLNNFFQAYIYFKKNNLDTTSKNTVYGKANASGTSSKMATAIHIAISESIERWAFWETVNKDPEKYGFNIDKTTAGMAAYPSYFKKTVQQKSLSEARERWTMKSFWEGQLKYEKINKFYTKKHLNLDGIKIESLWNKHFTSILWCTLPDHPNHQAFAFSGSTTEKSAYLKCIVELERNVRVLNKFYSTYSKKISKDKLTIGEQRLLFFSSPAGQKVFSEKLQNLGTPKSIKPPNLIINSEIPGPWSKYATVWRSLYEDNFHEAQSGDSYFYF